MADEDQDDVGPAWGAPAGPHEVWHSRDYNPRKAEWIAGQMKFWPVEYVEAMALLEGCAHPLVVHAARELLHERYPDWQENIMHRQEEAYLRRQAELKAAYLRGQAEPEPQAELDEP